MTLSEKSQYGAGASEEAMLGACESPAAGARGWTPYYPRSQASPRVLRSRRAGPTALCMPRTMLEPSTIRGMHVCDNHDVSHGSTLLWIQPGSAVTNVSTRCWSEEAKRDQRQRQTNVGWAKSPLCQPPDRAWVSALG